MTGKKNGRSLVETPMLPDENQTFQQASHMTDKVELIIDPGRIRLVLNLPVVAILHRGSLAAAIATLSAGDLIAYIDCCGPPEDLVKARLEERNLAGMLELMEDDHSVSLLSSLNSPSSDDEFSTGRTLKSGGNSEQMGRRTEAIVCYPRSRLVAVMIQALAHRLNHPWVIETDCSIVGMVTFARILEVFRNRVSTFS
ncbi:hypothetical protein Ancab_005215 [Ancistrocladus abbreviatus]